MESVDSSGFILFIGGLWEGNALDGWPVPTLMQAILAGRSSRRVGGIDQFTDELSQGLMFWAIVGFDEKCAQVYLRGPPSRRTFWFMRDDKLPAAAPTQVPAVTA